MSKLKNLNEKLTLAISSRALFELEEENSIYEKKGDEAYYRYQIKNENKILKPGTAFPLVKAFLELNQKYLERKYLESSKNSQNMPQKKGEAKPKKKPTSAGSKENFYEKHRLIEVIIVSRNRAEAGIRIFKSIEKYKLDIKKAAFLGGDTRSGYLKAFKVDLFLSREAHDVAEAVNNNIPAAMLYSPPHSTLSKQKSSGSIRIALDCDGVIFSEASERIYKAKHMHGFLKHELENAAKKLPDGPFARFIRSIALMQKNYEIHKRPIKLAIVTSRSGPAQERVIRTLREWQVPINCAFFLGNKDKKSILDVFKPHIFFDDQKRHLNEAASSTPSAKVPWPKKRKLASRPPGSKNSKPKTKSASSRQQLMPPKTSPKPKPQIQKPL